MARKKESNSKVALKRLITILTLLNANRLPHSVNEIMEDEDVQDFFDPNISIESKKRMLRRDLQDLIALNFVEAIVEEKNRQAKSYRVNSDKKETLSKLLNLDVNRDMLVALSLSQNIFRYFDNTYLKDDLDDLNKTLTQTFSFSAPDSGGNSSNIQVKLGPTSIFSSSKSDILSNADYAISDLCKIDIEYQTIGQSKPLIMRNLEPHRLILQDDNFYLLVYNPSPDKSHKGFRTLNLMRFKDLTILEDKFEKRDTSVIDEKLKNSFGIFTAGEPETVKIIFSKEDRAMEKRLLEKNWHHSAVVKEKSDTIELTLFVNINDEFARWVLSWGNSIISVEPKSLRDRLNNINKSSW